MSEWLPVVLGDLIEVRHGYAFPGENIREQPPGDILLTPGNFAVGGGFKGDKFKYFDGLVPAEYVLEEGDLIVTMTDLSKESDTLGFPALVPGGFGPRYLHNQRLGKVVVKNGARIDKRFLFHLLKTSAYRHEILASATGTTVKHTSPSRILAYKTTIPDLKTQQAIAHVLGSLDDRLQLNRRMNETLEAMARALFKDWFVDFGPVRAKMEGRQPPGLSPEIAALFPDKLDREGKPEGWAFGVLQDLLILQRGFDLPASDRTLGPHPIIAAGGLNGHHSIAMARGPGVVTGRSGVLGNVHLLMEDFWPLNTTLWVREFRRAGPFYSFELLQLLDFEAFNAGSAVPTLNRNHVHGLPAVIPPPECVSAFETMASSLHRRVRKSKQESESLSALSDLLLPKLLSGELRVLDEECCMEHVA